MSKWDLSEVVKEIVHINVCPSMYSTVHCSQSWMVPSLKRNSPTAFKLFSIFYNKVRKP